MTWPQYFMIAMYVLNVWASAAMHGKPRAGKVDVMGTLIGVAAGALILYYGGFWAPLFK